MNRREALSVLAGGMGGTVAKSAERPNFLFILADQFRGDALGADGNKQTITPNLDKLASGGVRFASAYVPQAVCTPSRASLLTSVYPTTHGLTDNVYGVDTVFTDKRYRLTPHYPGLLREAGYHTGYIGKWHLGEKNPEVFDFWNGYNSQLSHWLGARDESPYRSDVETDEAIGFMERNANRPFALTVSYYPPHTPYVPPARFVKMHAGGPLEPAEYYAACTAIDHCVGRLLDALEKRGLGPRTMVIFTSDHGETFGRRLLSSNKRVCYEDSARVPMLIRYPDRLPAGKVFEGGVSTMDLMPTMLEAGGIRVPSAVQARSRFRQILDGKLGWSEPVFQQNVTQPKLMGGPHDERMVRMREWKLILRRFRGREAPPAAGIELFSLADDPGEQADQSLQPAARGKIRELAGMMRDWGRRINDPVAVELAGQRLA
ncbi:MAG: hypothetical protein FJW20_20285 [Acidimicrobiia bacterium]|nr:hypothetical protein [Acidimicrobiia bacterium]